MAQTKKRQYKKPKDAQAVPVPRRYEMHPVYSILVNGRVYTSKSLSDHVAEEYIKSGGSLHVFSKIKD